jgi:23S rRNA U2552 (ribose-2'-O)-methylase RlmE/FtsJ
MTCFILPQTVLNTPTMNDLSSTPVSLTTYIKNQNVCCVHECVNADQILSDFTIKYKLTPPIWMMTNRIPETSYSVMFNSTNQLHVHELSMLTSGGTYISKMMDSTSEESIQFLFKLCSSFRNVCICKPESVCSLSSIKYVVATDFLQPPKPGIYEIPYYFKMVVDEMNSTYGQIQLEHLRTHNLSLGKI